MLKHCKNALLGIHLLFLLHTVQTFVLLTANIDDVKKLARKFVSDDIAEKIGDIIAKASLKIADEAFEEKPINDSKVSEENKYYNKVLRHGFDNQSSKKPKTTKQSKNKESFELTTKKDVIKQEKKHKKSNKSDYSHQNMYVTIPKLVPDETVDKKTEITIKTKQRKRSKRLRNRVYSDESNETTTSNCTNKKNNKLNAFNISPLKPVEVHKELNTNETKTNDTLYDSNETNPAPDLEYDKIKYKDIDTNKIPVGARKRSKFSRADDEEDPPESEQTQMTNDWSDKEFPNPDEDDSQTWIKDSSLGA